MGRWEEPVRLEPLPLPERAARFWEDEKLGVVSLIAIDIDNQSRIASKYGNLAARNLVREIGQQIKVELSYLEKYANVPLYHIYADRFYLLLDGISLEDAQNEARQLKQSLNGDYTIRSSSITLSEQSISPEKSLDIKNITVHLVVSTYPYTKLEEVLRRSTYKNAIAGARDIIVGSINGSLSKGASKGDVIISWNPGGWNYIEL
jgi:GGDEF domain-containing protein